MGNKKKRSKLLVLLLVLAMIFTALPAALAENVADSADTSQTETKATEESSDAITTDQSTTDTNSDVTEDTSAVTEDTSETEAEDAPAVMSLDAAETPTLYATADLSGSGRSFAITIQLRQADTSSPTVAERTFTVTAPGNYRAAIRVSSNNSSWGNSATVTTDNSGKATVYAFANSFANSFGYNNDTISSTLTVTPVQPDDADISAESLTTSVSFTQTGNWYGGYSYTYTASPGTLNFTIAQPVGLIGRTFNLTAQVYYTGTTTPVQGKAFKLYRTDTVTGNYDNSPQICYSDANGVVTFPVQIDRTKTTDARTFTYKILPVSSDITPDTADQVNEATAVVKLRSASGWLPDTNYRYELSGVKGDSNLVQTFYYTEPTPGGGGTTTTEYPSYLLSKSLTETDDGYNIELTAKGLAQDSPINREFILIIDTSASMSGGRLAKLQNVLTKSGGFIDTITNNVGTAGAGTVKVSLVTYSGRAIVQQTMTTMQKSGTGENTIQSLKDEINGLTASGATNYQQGLNEAKNLYTDTSSEKVMVFLSDGEPTFYDTNGSGNGDSCSLATQKATNQAIVGFKTANPTATCYSIYYKDSAGTRVDADVVGDENNNRDDDNIYGTDNFMNSIARSASDNGSTTAGNLFEASDEAGIQAAFDKIASLHTDMDSANIQDPLSIYVNYATGLTDAVVELSTDNGTSWTPQTKVTDYTVVGNGIRMNKTITTTDTIRLTIPVVVADSAYKYFYEKNGKYPDDAGGFYSNENATFTGNVGNTTYQGTFTNPTFTVSHVPRMLITKKDSTGADLSGATFELTRLNADGTTSPRTATSDSNGSAGFTNIPLGNYVLKETGVPENHISNIPAAGVYVTATLNEAKEVVLTYYSYDGTTAGTTPLTTEQLAAYGITKNADESLTIVNQSTKLSVNLIKKDSESTYLAGAEFALYDNAGCTGTPAATVTSTDSSTGAVFSAQITSCITYYLKETKAPAGYAVDPTVYTIVAYSSTSGTTVNTAEGGNKVSITAQTTSGTATITATNYEQTPLPLTGGSNNQWYLVAGLVALAGGGLLIFRYYVTRRTGGRI